MLPIVSTKDWESHLTYLYLSLMHCSSGHKLDLYDGRDGLDTQLTSSVDAVVDLTEGCPAFCCAPSLQVQEKPIIAETPQSKRISQRNNWASGIRNLIRNNRIHSA